MIRIVAFSALAFLAIAPEALAASDNPAIGRWFTEGDEGGLHAQFVWDIRSDGTFAKDIRTIADCKVQKRWSETGKWTYDNSLLTSFTDVVDQQPVKPAPYIDKFVVTPVDATHATYFDSGTEITWSMSIAGKDFAFPIPKGCEV